jgi:hypothetical protein
MMEKIEYKLVIYYDGGYENIYGIFPSEVARFLRKSDDVLENGFESRFIDFPHEHGYVKIDDEENIRILDKMPEEEGYSELILLNGDYLYGQGKGRVIEVSRDKIFSFDAYEDTEEYTLDRFIERVNNF